MRYLILGASEVRDEAGRPLPLGGQRLRALLAALALRAHNRAPASQETLIDEVWADVSPEARPENAPAALQALVSRLRRALGKDAVETLPGGYRIRIDPERDDVDLVRFEELVADGERALAAGEPDRAAAVLREGLALWRGPAVADLPDRTSAAARAEALRHTALLHRLTADLALGRAERILPELRELVPERPLDEPLQTLYLRALHESGRTAEALAAYASVRRDLAARLGADPGSELRALHTELLSAGAEEEPPGPDARRPSGPWRPGRRPGPGVVLAEPRNAPYGAAAAPGRGARGRPARQPSAGPQTGLAAARGSARVPAPTPAPDRVPAPGAAPPGNLRSRLTSFVGREADIAAIRSDLGAARLVTLIGPGGAGKTRLAERVAATAAAADPAPYPDGTWLVELAPLDHPAAVPGAVLSALGRRVTSLSSAATESARPLAGEGDPTALLIEHLEQRRLLLVLDNCEHVVHAAAGLAETLLAHCPGLTVLSTSRERLDVQGETVRPVEPLPPASAHRLFADRAAAASPGFRPGADPDAVAEICRRLDGLPLAIELAAARLRSLTPRQTADRLDDRFRLLTSGSRTVLPRQQTLRAVVDWSWDLLDDRERAVVRRLSVFAGGCTLSAAEHVCARSVPTVADSASGATAAVPTAGGGASGRADTAPATGDGPPGAAYGPLGAAAYGPPETADRPSGAVGRPPGVPADCARAGADSGHAEGPVSAPEGPASAPEGPASASDGLTSASDGLTSAPEGLASAPDGPPEGTGRAADPDIRPDEVLDLLSALVDKSLLVADQPPDPCGTGMRYRMLETIHDYARERAADHPAERRAAEARHTAQLLRFARAAEPRLRSAEQLSWLPRVEADLDNIRAALRRSLTHGDRDTAVAFVRAAGWFWWLRNYRDEGAHWVESVLALLPATAAERDPEEELLFRELQLLDCFLLAEHHAQTLLTDPYHRAVAGELVATFREPGPAAARFPGIFWPFAGYLVDGSKAVTPLMDLAVANCRRHSEPWGLAVALLFRAHVRIDRPGGLSLTHDDLPEIGSLAASTGDRWLLGQLCGLRAETALQEGRYDDARADFETALRYAEQLGALTEVPLLLARIADVWFRRGDTGQADRLARRAVAEAERLGIRDALTLGVFLRAVAATEAGDLVSARALHGQAEEHAAVGSPPAMFDVMLRVLDARITASEGAGPPVAAVRKIATALRLGLEVGVPEHLVGQALLTAGYILHLAGRHAAAVEFADAARRRRGALPPSFPELRLDRAVRAYIPAGGAAGRRPPLTGVRAVERLDELCGQFGADSSTETAPPTVAG
ncbi:BTAD domain-containing putative transcriptional regulator [Streptomyces qinglanensis]|uniref:Transcriptional regulatory protein, C terminal n=1 Tax=Streptomyces qinglanensis TaxID=943816 RepID=A0A1H9QA62_9ACTN|nr:BTAD domain-containing putative transcriptional regulator [Streptomyces qinglanensis]SER57298.1 Transcriptional regulatory protein, C terminal [Streptomyces qinglanensis]